MPTASWSALLQRNDQARGGKYPPAALRLHQIRPHPVAGDRQQQRQRQGQGTQQPDHPSSHQGNGSGESDQAGRSSSSSHCAISRHWSGESDGLACR
jgi:hypothetical protein